MKIASGFRDTARFVCRNGRTLAALAAGLALIVFLRVPRSKVFHTENLLLLLQWAPVLMLAAFARQRPESNASSQQPVARRFLFLAALCGTMTLFLFSSIVRHRWFYFLRWLPEPFGSQWLNSTGWWFATLTAVLFPLALFWPRRLNWGLWPLLILTQVYAFIGLMQVTDGYFIGKDDHPSFAFRLWQFSETFPYLVNYNPWWNAGLTEFYPLSSGTHAPGLLLLPMLRLFPADAVYTPGLGFLLLFFVPTLAALSIRALRAGAPAQAAAAILTLGVSQHFYLWLMNFGTLGSSLTHALIIPASALLYRMIVMRRRDALTVVGLTLTVVLMCFHALAMLFVIPLSVSAALQWRRWKWRPILALAIGAAVTVFLHVGTLRTFIGGIELSSIASGRRRSFLPQPDVELWSGEYWIEGWNHILAHLREGHPIILFLGLLGLLFTPHRRLRMWCLPILGVLAWLCGWGRFHFPTLQLSRMAIPLLFAAVVPAAIHVGDVLKTTERRWALWRSILLVLLVLTGLNVVRMYRVEGRAGYHVFSEQNRNMMAWIRENTSPYSRVLFAGESVHAYGGGHIAIFPMLTKREMMASDYYHFDPNETEYEFPPAPFRSSIEGWIDYMERYNVGTVATPHERWIRFFSEHPDTFEFRTTWDDYTGIRVYRVNRACNGRLWRGRGTATAAFNRIDVTVEPGQHEIVLGYNWENGLTADSPAEAFPVAMTNGFPLVGLRLNGAETTTVRFAR